MELLRYEKKLYDGCSVSPFIFHKGICLMRDFETSDKKAKYAYVRDSVDNGNLDELKLQILTCVYRFGFLNSFLINRALGNKAEGRNLGDAISYLVKHGFLKKLYGNYGASNTKYFYSVDKGVAQYLRINSEVETSLYSEQIDFAYNYLSRSQFALAAESSPMFKDSTLHTKLVLKRQNKEIDLGYSAVLKLKRTRIRLVAIPVRRFPLWWEDAVQRVRLALCLEIRKKTISLPVCICEDYEHMQELADELATNEKTAGKEVLFTTDAYTASGDVAGIFFEVRDSMKVKDSTGKERCVAMLKKVRLK